MLSINNKIINHNSLILHKKSVKKKCIQVSLAEVNNKCLCHVHHVYKRKLNKSILKASVVTGHNNVLDKVLC